MQKIEKGVESDGLSLTTEQVKHIRCALMGFITECRKNEKVRYFTGTINELEALLEILPQPEKMAIDETGQFYNINYELRRTYVKVLGGVWRDDK